MNRKDDKISSLNFSKFCRESSNPESLKNLLFPPIYFLYLKDLWLTS